MASTLLAQIKANLKKKKTVLLQKKTKNIIELLNALWDEKIIYGYSILKSDFVKIFLKFSKVGKPLIQQINLLSTSGRHLYMPIHEIKKLHPTQKNFFFFFSTSKGILSQKKALDLNLGGEILFSIRL
jgi:ribosomal protein S8